MNLQADYKNMPGHWVLASLGKKVLRPGGLQMTRQMLADLNIDEQDEVIEFAPGLGVTAQITLRKNPLKYVAIEQNEEAAGIVRSYVNGNNRDVLIANAEHVPLPDASATIIYGEAMLTMQTPAQKSRIIAEAKRLLKPGGRYGIHEMNMTPVDLEESARKEIRQHLAKSIRVNVAPLTEAEWQQLLIQQGFKIISVHTAPMHLLHLRRLIQDEGLKGVLKIAGNIVKNRQARDRVLTMRKQFVKHAAHLQGISIVAELLPVGHTK
ncbi:class I SAM-dependent methyltransferase [Paenibacillus apiarius]|uniref:class I SAM-dependent methyltransferase n=1 Tax=Paenibacillus apiarius TaxID=46240 RepID=UPI0019801828|nr:class I SAM-dependent methyltransferase [Paenibacillus apiarius]MBN3525253.1 methyltransferase domain-containing protein [Paenibacillus apiarius]